MNVLVVGGTRFVGAAIVDALLDRHHAVTLFSRGETNPGLFARLEHVRGDRRTDLGRLASRRFDVVIDTCGYTPEPVALLAIQAAAMGAFYVFVSSASVYAGGLPGPLAEEAPLSALDPSMPIDAGKNYGAAKALCEGEVAAALAGRAAIVRPGLIVGPRDYSDRYTYWVSRLSRKGPVLGPGDGTDPAQMIDARDLAAFVVVLAENERGGVFNASGPAQSARFADLLEATQTSERAEIIWAPAAFLAAEQVGPWSEMPCWLPRDHEAASILRLDCSAASSAGLRLRPWSRTAADTRAWISESGHVVRLAGIGAQRERELIARLPGG